MQPTIEKAKAAKERLAEVNRIVRENGYSPARLIPILQEVQEIYKYLSSEIISYVASSLNVPPSQVYGVATFYAHFSLTPKGKYVFRLCDGTACHVKKSHSILNALYQRLGLSESKQTSEDLMYTVETVSCLGACGLAPVMLMNEEVHGQVTPEQALAIIDRLEQQEAAAEQAE